MQRVWIRNIILLLFIFSGISGLIYQIVWNRMLVLIFGNTLLATSTVLSSFMAGLALGSYLLGKYIDKKPRALIRIYAILETGIGLAALLFPLLLKIIGPLYAGLYEVTDGNLLVLNLSRFLSCFILILLPTTLMGGTLPVLVKLFTERSSTLGRRMGLLYGLNTAGAVTGSIICGFILLKILGVQHTSWIAIAINLGVGLLAWLISKKDHSFSNKPKEPVIKASGEQEIVYSRNTVLLVLVGIGISGFCALAYEVFWIRMLNLFFRNTVYSFTTILATFLTGIMIGSLLYSAFFSKIKKQPMLFVVLEILIGLCAYATPFTFNIFYETLFSSEAEWMIIAKSSIIMILPTIFMGMALPAAVHICRKGPEKEGQSVGNVYSINTIGSILGAFIAGFVLIPGLGLHKSVILVAGLNIIAGGMIIISLTNLRAKIINGISIILLITLLFIIAPTELFRNLYQRTKPHAKIMSYKEGTICNVLVYDFYKQGYKDLYLNGVEEASSRIWHVQLFKMLGILPTLVHDSPDNALMIAFGAGMSAGACAGEVTSLECAELNPDITEVADIFRYENMNVLNNPKLTMIINDGRNYIYLTPKKYTHIISDATNPMSFDSWTLYTKEFYETCKQKLKPNGIFCQWVPSPLTGDALKIILNTFSSVFPHTSFWVIHGSSQCIMLATPEKLSIDYQKLSKKLSNVLKSSQLSDFGVNTTEKFLSFFFFGEEKLDQFLKGFELINTDDLPHAQFMGKLNREGIKTSLRLIDYQETIEPYLVNIGKNKEKVHQTLEKYLEINRCLNLGFLQTRNLEYKKALVLLEGSDLKDDANVKCMLKYDWKRKENFRNRIKDFPDDANAHNSLGFIYQMEKNYNDAISEYIRATELNPDFANAYVNLARAYLKNGMYDKAVEAYMKIRKMNPTANILHMVRGQLKNIYTLRKIQYMPYDPFLYVHLGKAYLQNGEVLKSTEAFYIADTLLPNNPEIMIALAGNYDYLQFKDKAIDVYEKLLRFYPDNNDIKSRLKAMRSKDPVSYADKYDADTVRAGARDNRNEKYYQAIKKWNEFEFDSKVSRENLYAAASDFEKIIKNDKNQINAYIDAATLYEILEEYNKAVIILKQAYKIAPSNELIKLNIERIELIDELHNKKPKGQALAEIYNKIGFLSLKNGDIQLAIQNYKRSLEINADYPNALANLGMNYIDSGEYNRALPALEKALELKPELTYLQERITWLRSIPEKSY